MARVQPVDDDSDGVLGAALDAATADAGDPGQEAAPSDLDANLPGAVVEEAHSPAAPGEARSTEEAAAPAPGGGRATTELAPDAESTTGAEGRAEEEPYSPQAAVQEEQENGRAAGERLPGGSAVEQSLLAAESAPAPCPGAARLEADVTLADGAHSIQSKLADPKHAFSIKDVKQLIHALRDLPGMIGTPVGAAAVHSDETKAEELKLMLTDASRARKYLRQIVTTSNGGDQARTEEIELLGELQDVLADLVFTRALGVVLRLVQSRGGQDTEQLLSAVLKACLNDMARPQDSRTIFTETKRPTRSNVDEKKEKEEEEGRRKKRMQTLEEFMTAACWMQWEDVGSEIEETGAEIQNQALATALKGSKVKEFTTDEFDAFKVSNLTFDSYIKVDSLHFRPVAAKKSVEMSCDLLGLWRAVHLSLRTTVAFNKLDTNTDGLITFKEFEQGVAEVGMPLEDIALLFRSMDADGNATISPNEFFCSLAGPVAKILERLVQALSAHDQWQHLLKLLCIMEDRGRMLAFAESLVSAAPSSLVDVVVSTIGFTTEGSEDTARQMQSLAVAMIKTCTCTQLAHVAMHRASAVQALLDASPELADNGSGDVYDCLRAFSLQRVFGSLHISSGSNEEKQVRELLLQDDALVKMLAQHPDKLALRAIELVADKDKKLFQSVGRRFCKEALGKWLHGLQKTSSIALGVEVDKIVSAVMHVLDTELVGLLLSLSSDNSTREGSQDSLQAIDMRSFLALWIRIIHALFQTDEGLLEGVLKHVAVLLLLRLGMQHDQASSLTNEIPWHAVRATLAKDFGRQKRPPQKLVVLRVVKFLKDGANWSTLNTSRREEAWGAFRKNFKKHLRCEVEEAFMRWGLQSPHTTLRIPFRLALEPHFEKAGVAWKDVAPVLDIITDEDVEKCKEKGGVGPVIRKLLFKLMETCAPAAKKWVVSQLKRAVQPQLEKAQMITQASEKGASGANTAVGIGSSVAWEDLTPVLDAITAEDLKTCVDKGSVEPILQKLTEDSARVAKTWIIARLHQTYESQIGQGVTQADVALVFEAITTDAWLESVQRGRLEPALLDKLAEACSVLATKLVVAQLRVLVGPHLRRALLAWKDVAPVLKALKMDELEACRARGTVEPILEKLEEQARSLTVQKLLRIMKGQAFQSAAKQCWSELKVPSALERQLNEDVNSMLAAWGSVQVAVEDAKQACGQALDVLDCDFNQVDVLGDAGFEVKEEERQQLIQAVVDNAASNWEVVADLVTDPTSAPGTLLKAMDTCAADTRPREILQKIVRHILRDKLVQQGIDEEDADGLLALLEQVSFDLAQGFSNPQSAVLKMVKLFDELQGPDDDDDDDDAPSSDAHLLLRCARAVAVHHLQVQLAKRGYDSRAPELAEAVVESMPTDQLAAAMTKDPLQLLRLVLHKGVQAGFDFAQEWFEECTEELKEDVRTTFMLILGASEEQCDKIAEQMAGGFEDFDEVDDILEAAAAGVADKKLGLGGFAGGGLLAGVWHWCTKRLLMSFDLVSDATVAYQMCDPASFGDECRYGSRVPTSGKLSMEDQGHVETRKVFFALAVVFLCLSWSVLWWAVCRHFVRPTFCDTRILKALLGSMDYIETQAGGGQLVRCVEAVTPKSHIKLVFRFVLECLKFLCFVLCSVLMWIVWPFGLLGAFLFLPFFARRRRRRRRLFVFGGSYMYIQLLIYFLIFPPVYVFVLSCLVFGVVLLLPVVAWYGIALLLHRVNVLDKPQAPKYDIETTYKRGTEITTLVFTVATLPLGALGLVAVEVYSQLFASTEPLQGAFWSEYENAKRVIEPALEALWQALLQFAYTLWRWRTGQLEKLDSDFYLTCASIAASVMQLYQIFHYLLDLKVAYRLSWQAVVGKLLSLGSDTQAPFLFVLRSWPRVDYSRLHDKALGKNPADTMLVGQIADALAGNDKLESLTFGSHQLSEERVEVLAQALRANAHLREFVVVDTDGRATTGEEMSGRGLPGACVNKILEAAPHLVKVRIEGVRRTSAHWSTLAAALAPMRLESFGLTYKAAKEPVQLGLKWEEVGSDKVAGRLLEIENDALAAALQNNVEFSRETFATFQVEELAHDSCIKVGEKLKLFKPARVIFCKGDRVQLATDASKQGIIERFSDGSGVDGSARSYVVEWDDGTSSVPYAGDIIRVQEKDLEKDLEPKQAAAAAAAAAKVLAGMRTLDELRLRGLPCGLLEPMLRPAGLPRSRSLRAVDLSFNAFERRALKALAAWVRKGTVAEVVCQAVVLVVSDSEPREKHRIGIEGVYGLVKDVSATSSKVEVCVVTLDHPLQSSQGAGARAAVVGAVREKELKRLANICDAAASATRTGRLLCVGLHDSTARGSSLGAHQRGVWAEITRKVMRVVRGLLRQVLPCFAFADDKLESVCASLALQDVGKSGGVHSISRCCRELCATKAALVTFCMLRRVPDGFALDVRVLLQELLSRVQRKQVHRTREQFLIVSRHHAVRLVSCGISGTNIGRWLSLFKECRRLSLVDSKLERAELTKMRLFLQHRTSGGCFPWEGCWRSAAGYDSRLEQLDFVSANPVTPDVAMALMHLAHDVQGIECTLGARRDFQFSHKDMTQVVGTIRSSKSSDFFKNDMAPVLKRSAGEWEELREASTRLQNRQVGSIEADFQALLQKRSEPWLAQAYVMLLRHRTFDTALLHACINAIATSGVTQADVLQERAKREGVVALLIAPTQAAGALDVADDKGNTALQHACLHGVCSVAEQLLAAGAKHDLVNRGRTALMTASEHGFPDIVAALLAAGAKPELADTRGRTALALACVKVGSMERLSGGEAGAESEDGIAVGSWVRATVTFTSDSRAAKQVPKGLLGKVKRIDGNGNAYTDFEGIEDAQWLRKGRVGNLAVLSQADVLQERAKREEAVALLIAPTRAAGALDAADDEGNTALQHACLHGVCSVAEQLLAGGAKHDLVNDEGNTALQYACLHGLCSLAEQLLAAGAKPDLVNKENKTALLLACAHGHEAAAALLVDPIKAADALDAVGDDGFSALLWAEECGLRSVAQKLRECGAAAVRRPALSLFRGEPAKVQIKVAERTVAFVDGFVTVRSAQRCPLGGKGYYELEILERDDKCPQYGFAAPAFERMLGSSSVGVGDDDKSWALDGTRQRKWHNGEETYPSRWKVGNVIGLACDLSTMQMYASVNGSFAAPNGAVFELDPDTVHDGLFAAFTGLSGKVRYNLGEAPFKHAPPAADYQAFAAFEA